VIDIAFFAANAIKIPDGGWFPLVVGVVSFTVLTTWRRGRKLVNEEMASSNMPLESFIEYTANVHRVGGTAVFMTSSSDGVPSALLHNLKHNQILHERVVLMTIKTADQPFVKHSKQVEISDLGQNFTRITVTYGFMQNPDVPRVLKHCETKGMIFDMMSTTFYVARESVVRAVKSSFTPWRAHIFRLMSKNATSATDFFKIPANRVVELGTQIEI
jgi:KUP system potassium uptake protein